MKPLFAPVLVVAAVAASAFALPAAGTHESLSALNADFKARRTKALDEIAMAQAKALEAYLSTNPDADDANRARMQLVELASERKDWSAVVRHADALIEADPDGESAVAAEYHKAQALGAQGQNDAAIALMNSAVEKMDDIGMQVDSFMMLADLHLAKGDVEGAKTAYASMKSTIKHPQIAGMADQMLKDLEQIGEVPIPIDVTAMDGKPLKLEDYKGKVTLIDFWATWCGPCVAEMPNVVDAYEKFHDKGFEIVGISLDNEGEEQKVKDFLAENNMPWRQFYDGQGWGNAVAQDYGIQSIPATYLLDREGNVIRMNVRGEALHRAIEAALAK